MSEKSEIQAERGVFRMAKTTIWNGASADWSLSTDWSNGLPNGAADVVVSPPAAPSGLYTLTISAPQTARSLTINDPNATVADQGALTISGKNALTVAAGVFQLAYGGSVVGGTLSATGGAFQWNGGTLINSSYQGVLDLSTNDASLDVVGGLTFVGATAANPATLDVTGLNASLTFVGTQTLSRDIINLSNSTGVYGPSYLESNDANGLGATLTLANTVTVNSYDNSIIALSDGANDVFVNGGTINALEQPQGSLIIEGFDGSAPVLNTFKNTGALDITGTLTPGGPVNLGSAERVFIETGNFVNSGQVTIGGQSVLNVMLGRQGIPGEANAVTTGGQASNSGAITLQDGGFLQVAGNFTNTGYVYLHSSDDPTEIEIDNVAPFVNKGHIILSDNTNNLIYGALLAAAPVTPTGGGPTDTTGGFVPTTGGGPTNTSGGPVPTSGGGSPGSPGGGAVGGVPASFDNFGTLSGAGQIGKGDKTLALANFGTIDANGIQALVLDTGLTIGSTGLVEALGFGGITLEDSLATVDGGVKVAAISKLNLDGASLLGGNVTNQGLLEATGGSALPSQIAMAAVTNTGTLESLNGTTLTLAGDTITGGGTILASDPVVATPSTILLEGTTINGGKLQTLNGGVITTIAGDSQTVLNNVTVDDGTTVNDANGSALGLEGTITLAGVGAVIRDGAEFSTPPIGQTWTTGLEILGNVTIKGSGRIDNDAANPSPSAVFSSISGSVLTNNAIIAGDEYIGQIYNVSAQAGGSTLLTPEDLNNLTLINSGTIVGQETISTGHIVQNRGTINATAGSDGGLTIDDEVDGGGLLSASDEGILGIASLVVGARLATSGSGIIASGVLSELKNVTVDAGAAATVLGDGAISGDLHLRTSSAGSAIFSAVESFYVDQNLSLVDGGAFHLGVQGSPSLQSTSGTLGAKSSATLNNHDTIDGFGRVGDRFFEGFLNFDNFGVVDADTSSVVGPENDSNPEGAATLVVSTANVVTNSGTLEATNGGELVLEDAISDSSTGTVKAAANSIVDLSHGGSISGGKVTIQAGGTLQADDPSAASAISNAVIGNAGTLEALAGATLTLQGDTINGSGTLLASDPVVTPSNLDLVSTTINGGTLQTSNGGVITTVAGDNATVLNNVTVADETTVDDADGSTLGLKGTITLAGTEAVLHAGRNDVAPPAGQTFVAGINIVGNVTLKGSGNINLGNSYVGSGDLFSNTPGSVVSNYAAILGAGTIGRTSTFTTNNDGSFSDVEYGANDLTLINKGTISGSESIATGHAIQNTGTISASDGPGETLSIYDEVDGGGLLSANYGSLLEIDSLVSGARLSTNGGGVIKTYVGALKDVSVDAGSSAIVYGNVNISGNVRLKTSAVGSGTFVGVGVFDVDQTLNLLGGGVFHLGSEANNYFQAQYGLIGAKAAATLNNHDAIDGFGRIGQSSSGAFLTFNNFGVVDADTPSVAGLSQLDAPFDANPEGAATLVIDTGNIVNNAGGVLEATNGGKLIVKDTVQFGSAKVASGSTLEFGAGESFVNISFDNSAGFAGTLALDQPGALAVSTISGFLSDGAGHSDGIDLGGLSAADSWSFTENLAGTQGVLSIHDATYGAINLLLDGHYLAGGHSTSSASSSLFSLATDGGTGALLTTSAHS